MLTVSLFPFLTDASPSSSTLTLAREMFFPINDVINAFFRCVRYDVPRDGAIRCRHENARVPGTAHDTRHLVEKEGGDGF